MMSDPAQLAYLIPLLPLLAFVFLVLAGSVKQWVTGDIRLSDHLAHRVSIGAIFISWLLAIAILVDIVGRHGQTYIHSYPWLQLGASGALGSSAGGLQISFGWMVDPLTALMLIVVTTVTLMVQIFSTGYMAGDVRYPRFFAYLSLFGAAMLALVLANSLLELFIAWELVGLTSYLLIGFWFEKPTAKRAAMKAFLVTRIGDVGLFFGMAYLLSLTGTTDFVGLVIGNPETGALPFRSQGWLEAGIVAGPQIMALKGTVGLGLVALLIFAGSVGKSAQFPLHVWLPDAMEGPTPVSALIHAATMVAAGVYLVARMYPIFDLGGPLTALGATFRPLGLVGLTGAITAVMAAYFAFTQFDIKRVLAYSTISQLGYMMIGLGCGGVYAGVHDPSLGFTSGMFHLMTHAFFKGLLFLGSGAIIYACHHEQDMRRMGGLWKLTPITFWCYLTATLALAGLIPGGLFSKDSILEAAFGYNKLIFAAGVLGAFMTAGYMARQLVMVFAGEYSGGHEHGEHEHGDDGHLPHDPPLTMTVPLIILAVLAVVSGFVGIPGSMKIAGFLKYHALSHPEPAEHAMNWTVTSLGYGAALLGMATGLGSYSLQTRAFAFQTARPTALDWFLYQLSYQKGWFDEIYRATLVRGLFLVSDAAAWMDRWIVDGIVNGLGWLTRQLAFLSALVDRFIVDGLVNLVAVVSRGLGKGFRTVQSGQVQTYLLVATLGAILLIWAVAAGQIGAPTP